MKRDRKQTENGIISIQKHEQNYSLIDNAGLRDSTLSYKATGLWAFLISHPPDWQINVSHLAKSKSDGRDSVLSGLYELYEAGYLLYLRWRDTDGMFSSQYIVFESSQLKARYLDQLREEDKAKTTAPYNPKSRTKHQSETTTENPTWRENGKTVTEKPQRENRYGKPDETNNIYTNDLETNDLSVYQDAHTRGKTHTGFGKISEPESEASKVLTSTQTINQPVQQIQTLEKDQFSGAGLTKKSIKYDAALGMRPPAPRVKYLIPDGDWLNERGQLDPAFINHVAKQWMDSPGAAFHKMPIEEVEGKVFSHFANNHAKLVVAWESYSKVALRHAQGVKLRLDAEIAIPESEQQQIVNQGRAIASALSQPEEEKAVPSLPTQENQKPFGFVLPETTAPEPKAIKSAEPTPEPKAEPKAVTQHPSVIDCDWLSTAELTQIAVLKEFGFKKIGMTGQVDEPVSDLLIDKYGSWEFYPVLGQPGILEARCKDVVFAGDIGEVDYEIQVAELIAIFKKSEPTAPIAENSTAYQPYESGDITPQQQQANMAKLSRLLRSATKSLPPAEKNIKRAVSSFPSNLLEANQWILDPCLRAQAVIWAKREGYLIHFTSEGVPFEIEDPEF